MSIDDVMKHFNNKVAEVAKAVGCTRQTVYNWQEWGAIPELQQLKIEKVTEGKLQAD